jgi:hypothetical protein
VIQNTSGNEISEAVDQVPVPTTVPGSRRPPTTALLTVTMFALATSVGVTSICPQIVEANITIRVPIAIQLGKELPFMFLAAFFLLV